MYARHGHDGLPSNLGGPDLSTSVSRHGDPGPMSPTAMRQYAHAAPAKNSAFLVVGRRQGETGAEADGGREVGGPNRSDDAGERLAPGPGRAKAARVVVNFRREP